MKAWLLALVALFGAGVSAKGADGWSPLFNGKDLAGWETYLAAPAGSTTPIGVNRDPHGAFSVVQVDGGPVLRIAGDVPGGAATLSSFSNYHLRVQFKWGARRSGAKPGQLANSGLLYHAHGSHGAGNGRWLPSHQFQLQTGHCGDYIAMGDAAALIPARGEAKKRGFAPGAEPVRFSNDPADAPRCAKVGGTEREGDWNTLEVYCFGDRWLHVLNGVPVLFGRSEVRGPDGGWTRLEAGRIELMAEGWEIFFRRVELRPLDAWPSDLAAVAGAR